jgi:hypothetical protein
VPWDAGGEKWLYPTPPNFILEERKSYYQGDNFFKDLQREMTHTSYFLKEHLLISTHTLVCSQTGSEKRKITKNFKTLVHLPRSLQRSVRYRRQNRFPIVPGDHSQTLQSGGRGGGLTARRNSRVRYLSGASANSNTNDASFVSITGNPNNAQISSKVSGTALGVPFNNWEIPA